MHQGDNHSNATSITSKLLRYQQESSKQSQRPESVKVLRDLLLGLGPCIVLESPRDVSRGPWLTLNLYQQYPSDKLGFGFC